MPINVVLVEPEIPQNTGNVSRTCVVTGSALHLIRPLGFSLDERYLRRAGLDYWKYLSLSVYDSMDDFYSLNPNADCLYFSSKAGTRFDRARYGGNCFLVFGSETRGLDASILAANEERCVRIPMKGGQRCLNLSNAVCVGVYEALRQTGFTGLV